MPCYVLISFVSKTIRVLLNLICFWHRTGCTLSRQVRACLCVHNPLTIAYPSPPLYPSLLTSPAPPPYLVDMDSSLETRHRTSSLSSCYCLSLSSLSPLLSLSLTHSSTLHLFLLCSLSLFLSLPSLQGCKYLD